MFERRLASWRHERPDILDLERVLGGDAIVGEVLVDGGPQEGAIDEKLEGHGFGRFEEGVDESGEGISTEI